MLSPYDRIMHEARITRHRETTYDHRSPEVLLAEYRATIDVLRQRVADLQATIQQARQAVKDSCRGLDQ